MRLLCSIALLCCLVGKSGAQGIGGVQGCYVYGDVPNTCEWFYGDEEGRTCVQDGSCTANGLCLAGLIPLFETNPNHVNHTGVFNSVELVGGVEAGALVINMQAFICYSSSSCDTDCLELPNGNMVCLKLLPAVEASWVVMDFVLGGHCVGQGTGGNSPPPLPLDP